MEATLASAPYEGHLVVSGDYTPSHVGLCVRSLERSMRFYCDGLGFEPSERYELDSKTLPGLERALEARDDVVMVSQMIERDGLRIQLLEFSEPRVVGSPSSRRTQLGLTHLCLYVADVDAAAEQLLEYGALVLDQTRASVGTEILCVMDPDGVRVELMRMGPPAHAPE
jgi:catechol 2,3-dioxygenase-like lactoylglutathione lyase family enzyme